MRSAKIWCSLFWLLFAVVMGQQASRLPMGEMREPGAGFFPLLIAVATGILALLALIEALKTKPTPLQEEAPSDEPFRWWSIAIILLALIAYALTLPTAGFLLNTFLFMLLLVKVIEPQSWTKSLLAAVVTAVVSELFFNVLLNAQIPKGFLGF
ncbi:MAG: tripartite tricarboxylate transporter TctB family protein [Deltaproteobacteria bacterium]|nr:tripartite tricarboxylate transporter TctB family protein [Deltaproteobacteria bacterium]